MDVDLNQGFFDDFEEWVVTPVGIGTMVLCAIVLALLGFVIRDEIGASRLWQIPGPPRLPIIGNIHYLLSEPWKQFFAFYKQYGTIFKLFIWGNPFVVVADPGMVRQLMQTEFKKFIKDNWSYTFFKPILGDGLVTSEGEKWRVHRNMLMPHLMHYERLQGLLPVFQEAANTLVDDLSVSASSTGKPVRLELDRTFRKVTLDVIAAVTVGMDSSKASGLPPLFSAIIDELNERLFQPWRQYLPLERDHRKRLETLDNMVLEMIHERRKQHRIRPPVKLTDDMDRNARADALSGLDLLDVLLLEDPNMVDKDLMDELKTMLLAGHETSSMMLTWAMYLLLLHPEKMRLAVEAVDGIWNKAEEEGRPVGAKDIKALEYLDWVLSEALRIFVPVPILAKRTITDVQFGEYKVPPNTQILVSVWALHHSPKIWGPDVEEFRPERHAKDARIKDYAFAFIPFSVGRRDCLGRHLAMLEAKVIFGTFLRKFSIRLAEGQTRDVTTDKYVIPVRPENGIYVEVQPRK